MTLYLKYIRLEKSRAVHASVLPIDDLKSYPSVGACLPYSPPIHFWIEGWLLRPIVVGKPVLMLRHVRNGVPRLGRFVSTPVMRIRNSHEFTTLNSVYDWKEIPLRTTDWWTG